MSINPLPEVVGQLDGGAVRARGDDRLALEGVTRCAHRRGVVRVSRAMTPRCGGGFLGPAGMAPDLVEKFTRPGDALRDPVVLAALEKDGRYCRGQLAEGIRRSHAR